MNKPLAILCMVLIWALVSGCASVSGADPIVGSWKQEEYNITIIMDFKENGTGVFTLDTSKLYPDMPGCPAVTSMDYSWKPLDNMSYEINTSDRPAPMKFVMTPSKDCIYESTRVSKLKLYRI